MTLLRATKAGAILVAPAAAVLLLLLTLLLALLSAIVAAESTVGRRSVRCVLVTLGRRRTHAVARGARRRTVQTVTLQVAGVAAVAHALLGRLRGRQTSLGGRRIGG